MCEATIEAREDVCRVWWPTVEYADEPSSLKDELHIELFDPPGRVAASREFFRDFQWEERYAVGRTLTWTFTRGVKLASVRAVGEFVEAVMSHREPGLG